MCESILYRYIIYFSVSFFNMNLFNGMMKHCHAYQSAKWCSGTIIRSLFLFPNYQRFAKSRSRCISCGVSRTQSCVLRGLGQRLNKQKPGISEAVEMPGFSHLYIQMHCLPLYAHPQNCIFKNNKRIHQWRIICRNVWRITESTIATLPHSCFL